MMKTSLLKQSVSKNNKNNNVNKKTISSLTDSCGSVQMIQNPRDVQLLIIIMQNVLNSPNNAQYHHINIKRLSKKLIVPKTCIHLLCQAGFVESNDNRTLFYDTNKSNELETMYQHLLSMKKRPENNTSSKMFNDLRISKAICGLWLVSITERDKVIDVSLKIINNILSDPQNAKYWHLNLTRVKLKLMNCKSCLELLFSIGFIKSENSPKCMWTLSKDNLNKLKIVRTTLQSMKSIDTKDDDQFIPDLTCDIRNLMKDNYDVSYHLLKPSAVCFTNDMCTRNSKLQCQSMMNIIQKIQKTNRTDEKSSDVMSNYNNVDLLNDFNHVLSKHSDPDEFEDIYNASCNGKPCQLSGCLMMRRNQRDRGRISNEEQLLNEIYTQCEGQDVVSQQLLDRVHCYFMHSFDIGHKLTRNDMYTVTKHHSNNLDNDSNMDENDSKMCHFYDSKINKIHKLIQSKKKNYQHIDGLNRLNNPNHKFKAITNSSNVQLYDYGCRFFYWENSKYDHGQWLKQVQPQAVQTYEKSWYIEKKYKSLQSELTNNIICRIGMIQYNNLFQKAQILMRTNQAKGMYCSRKNTAKCYDMYYGQPLSVEHLIAMMVYCNYDLLQNKFTETFRKANEGETDYELKEKHREYYFLAKLLIESVECFGMLYPSTTNITVYHGVSQQMSFSSMDAWIKGPFSTSTEFTVAVNFSNHNQGIILEMIIPIYGWHVSELEGVDSAQRITCMDMQWISDFANEKELFCIGGLNKLFYASIIEVTTAINYVLYIRGLRALSQSLSVGKTNTKYETFMVATKRDKQMAYRLLSHELSLYYPDDPQAHSFNGCPEYIQNLLHSHCSQVTSIFIGGEQDFFTTWFFAQNKRQWVELSVLCTVFPSLQSIYCKAYDKNTLWLNEALIIESVLNFISGNNNVPLNAIHIECIDSKMESEHVMRYNYNFRKFGWSIHVQNYNITDKFDLDHWVQMVSAENPQNALKVFANPAVKWMIKLLDLDQSYLQNVAKNPAEINRSKIIMKRQ